MKQIRTVTIPKNEATEESKIIYAKAQADWASSDFGFEAMNDLFAACDVFQGAVITYRDYTLDEISQFDDVA